jgi:tetratricopeptide (TPR) repeat protein
MKKYVAIFIMSLLAQIVIAEEAPKAAPADPQILKLETTVESLIVEKKDYALALNEYATAAKANPQATYYREQYAVLQRVIKMKKLLAEETNPEKWKSYAKATRSYVYNKGFYSEALETDRAAANKFDSGDYAANLLETLLLTGQNEEAAKFAESKQPADKTIRYQTLIAVVSARAGKTAEAVEAIKAVEVNPKTNPASYFDSARVYWAAGDKDKAMASLKTLLEHTPPSETPGVQEMIKRSVEFAPLRDSEELKVVLATESKVTQSGCTGGSNCGSCSLKNKCPSTK